MSRDIKFRVWDTEHKRWVYFGNPEPGKYQGELLIDFSSGVESFEAVLDMKTLTQYTGLKDHKGNEIYEGDIVTWGHGNVPVTFGTIPVDDYIPPKLGSGWIASDCFVDSDCEVIGNIYENPELLERGE